MRPQELERLPDSEILDYLKEVDESDQLVTSWEADFLESVLYLRRGQLTPLQKRAAAQIIVKYCDAL